MVTRKKKKRWSSSQIIIAGFGALILTGAFLLMLPVSSASGQWTPFIDALFTSTSAVCVTGLIVYDTYTHWSLFGQIFIITLIQIGGLGVVTVLSGVMISLHKKMGLGNRLLIQDTFNLNSLSGLVKFVKKVIKGTLLVEGIGALCYMTVFVPDFGLKGIWISVFNSVSAFCNAGIDIFASNSLCDYATNPVINIVTSLLIIIGGIGYVVWWDIIRIAKISPKYKLKSFGFLTLHSKIALLTTIILIISGGLLIFIFEYNNPLTLKDYSLFDKLQISFFQSVTTRTAGFASVDQQSLTNSSAIVSLLLMLIGGSPVGTAGGVKTVTVAILLVSAFATVGNKSEVSLFNRNVSKQALKKAVAVVTMFIIIMLTSALLLSAVTDAALVDILYETVSATATVGLSRNLTSTLNIWGKLIIIATMYLGRIGPISLAIAFNIKTTNKNIIKNPTEEISIG